MPTHGSGVSWESLEYPFSVTCVSPGHVAQGTPRRTQVCVLSHAGADGAFTRYRYYDTYGRDDVLEPFLEAGFTYTEVRTKVIGGMVVHEYAFDAIPDVRCMALTPRIRVGEERPKRPRHAHAHAIWMALRR